MSSLRPDGPALGGRSTDPRTGSSGSSARHAWRTLHGRRRTKLLVLALLPGLAAASVIAVLAGEPNGAILLFVALVVSATLLQFDRYPLHLMPVARGATHAMVPLLGLAGYWLSALLFLGAASIDWVAGCVAAVASILVRALGSRLLTAFRRRHPLRIAVIGGGQLSRRLRGALQDSNLPEYDVVGHIDLDRGQPHAHSCSLASDADRLGVIGDLRTIVTERAIDVLAFDCDAPLASVIEEITDVCLETRVRAIGYDELHEELLGYVPIGQIDAVWFRHMIHPRYRMILRPWRKRAFDIFVGALMAIPVAPLIGILALAVWLQDRGPVFFRQTRVGETGRPFEILKLRTMTIDGRSEGTELWSGPTDSRVTPLGRILRRTHLDELPQIFTVLRGQMTLVGPRPEQPRLASTLGHTVPYYPRRHLIRPGLTGWAQVSCGYGNTIIGNAWKVAHDLYYLKRRSLAFDLMIFAETIRAVLGDRQFLRDTPAEELLLDDVPRRSGAKLWVPPSAEWAVVSVASRPMTSDRVNPAPAGQARTHWPSTWVRNLRRRRLPDARSPRPYASPV